VYKNREKIYSFNIFFQFEITDGKQLIEKEHPQKVAACPYYSGNKSDV
jgi:hypothetical protein